MTLTDESKIDCKIKANQDQYDLGREAAKTSALSSKDLLEKCEYLTGEDLGQALPSVLEKTKFDILYWVYHLVNHLKKIMLKILRRVKMILIMTVTINFTIFTTGMMNLKRCHKFLSTIRSKNLIIFLLNLNLLSLKTQKHNSKR